MALDERRISTRTKLKAERQKAVMFATLHRVQQSLQDQGAQPQLRQGSEASASVPDTPFLWMPHGSADSIQQGLHGAKSLRTGSGSVRLKTVHKVHGLASPQHKGISNPTVTSNKTKTCTQSSSDHGVNASMPVTHPDRKYQREDAAANAKSSSWDSHTPHPLHKHTSTPLPTLPSMDPEATEQQQAAATGRQQPHPVSQHPHTHPYTHQHRAEGQHRQQHASAVSLEKPVEPHMSSPRHVEKHLAGVRPAAGGWEARIGRQGHSKAKESLGVHASAFAAARAYDRALLTNRRPSGQPNNFNFPVQDYVADESSKLSKAAMVQLHAFHAKPSSKRSRPSSAQATHQSPPSKRRATNTHHTQPSCAVDLTSGHSNAVPPLPVKQSWNRQTATDQHLHQTPVPAAEKPGEDADWHQVHGIPAQPEDHAQGQLHKPAQMERNSWQAETGRTAPVDGAHMAQRPELDSDLDEEPSISGNHRSQSSVLSGASLATSTQHTDHALLPEAELAADLDACTACACETDLASTGAAGGAAPDDATRHHKKPGRATISYKELLDTARQRECPSLHPVVRHAHRQAQGSPPHAAPGSSQFPDAPARPTQVQADGPDARHHAAAALPDKPAETTLGAPTHSDSHNPPSGSNAGQADAKPSSSTLSPEPETVRAGDSDDDVEIMDDSPVHKPVSSASWSRQGTPPSAEDRNQQQARPHRESAEGHLPPCSQEQQLPEQLPDQLLPEQQGLQTWQQQQGAQYCKSWQEQQQQQQPGKKFEEPQQQQQQQCFQHSMQQQFFQQEQQSSQQQKSQQQLHQKDGQAGLSTNPPYLSGLSHVAQHAFSTAGGEWLPPSTAAAGTAVKQEPAASQSHDSAHMPRGGHPSQEAVAGSSLTHPLELSESDADSSASSSVDPSQRVPPPWLHADTAASRQQEASGHGACASAQAAVPARSASAQVANRVLLRQASQGSTLNNGHLRTKRGPMDKAEGTRSKLARVVTAAVLPQQAAHENRRGATAAEAVDLSDDDDDVVIIEENMQPEPHPPQDIKGLKAPSAARQQGGPPASRSGWHFKPRVPAAAAAARAALCSPSSNVKPPATSSLAFPPSTTHAQAKQAGNGELQASSVLSATLAALKQASESQAQVVPDSAEEPAASAAAAAGVAELRRTEQQSNPEFKAAQEAEWQQRQAEIGKQAEHAQRLKRQRKAEKEKKARQEVEVARRLAEHRAEEGRKGAEEQEKDQIRVRIRQRLAGKLDKAKTLRQVLTAFGIPVEGGFMATSAQVDKAYKKAMIMFHPDKHVSRGLENQLEAEESFKIISHAKNKKSK